MKRIPKIISVLFALCVLASLFTACHGSKGLREFEMPDEFDTSRNYELTFWAKNDTNRTQMKIYQNAIKDFEALYPNIKIKLRLYTDYGKIYNDVITNIATGTTPNICITYPDHIATYLTGVNTVAPLDELFASEKYGLGGSEVRFDSVSRDEIIKKHLDECYFDGNYYAVPFMRSTEACYINKTYVEKLGYTVPDELTWDFVWEVSEAAMAKNEDGTFKVNGQNVLIPFIYKSTDNMMIQMLKQSGYSYSNESGEALLFNDDTKSLLYTVAEHAGTGAFSTFSISSYPANFLNAGQCIFAIDSTAGATWMGSDAPLSDISEDKIVKFETAVRTVPQFDTENPQMISQGPSICIFNKNDPQEVLASWLFTQYLLTDGVQISYSETEGYAPVTTTARNSAEYADYLSREGEDNDEHYDIKIKATKLLLENTENTFVTPVYNGSASLRNAAGQLIENVTKSMNRKETVDDAYMEKLFANVTSLYRIGEAGKSVSGKAELGALPGGSKALIIALAVIWVLIAVYFIVILKKKLTKHEK